MPASPPNTFHYLTPEGSAALTVVCISGPDAARLFRPRLPALGKPQHLVELEGVDQGLAHAFAPEAWILTLHGGTGVREALRLRLGQAGFDEGSHALIDPALTQGLSRYQRVALELLGTASKACAGMLLDMFWRAQQASAFPCDLAQFREDWKLVQPWLRVPQIALAGPTNAGKTTMFNALRDSGQALVSAEAGTTRDILRTVWTLTSGHEVELVDTPGTMDDEALARQGKASALVAMSIARGNDVAQRADLRLVLAPWDSVPVEAVDGIRIATKADLTGAEIPGWAELAVSVHTGAGMQELEQMVQARLFSALPKRMVPLCAEMAQSTSLEQLKAEWFYG